MATDFMVRLNSVDMNPLSTRSYDDMDVKEPVASPEKPQNRTLARSTFAYGAKMPLIIPPRTGELKEPTLADITNSMTAPKAPLSAAEPELVAPHLKVSVPVSASSLEARKLKRLTDSALLFRMPKALDDDDDLKIPPPIAERSESNLSTLSNAIEDDIKDPAMDDRFVTFSLPSKGLGKRASASVTLAAQTSTSAGSTMSGGSQELLDPRFVSYAVRGLDKRGSSSVTAPASDSSVAPVKLRMSCPGPLFKPPTAAPLPRIISTTKPSTEDGVAGVGRDKSKFPRVRSINVGPMATIDWSVAKIGLDSPESPDSKESATPPAREVDSATSADSESVGSSSVPPANPRTLTKSLSRSLSRKNSHLSDRRRQAVEREESVDSIASMATSDDDAKSTLSRSSSRRSMMGFPSTESLFRRLNTVDPAPNQVEAIPEEHPEELQRSSSSAQRAIRAVEVAHTASLGRGSVEGGSSDSIEDPRSRLSVMLNTAISGLSPAPLSVSGTSPLLTSQPDELSASASDHARASQPSPNALRAAAGSPPNLMPRSTLGTSWASAEGASDSLLRMSPISSITRANPTDNLGSAGRRATSAVVLAAAEAALAPSSFSQESIARNRFSAILQGAISHQLDATSSAPAIFSGDKMEGHNTSAVEQSAVSSSGDAPPLSRRASRRQAGRFSLTAAQQEISLAGPVRPAAESAAFDPDLAGPVDPTHQRRSAAAVALAALEAAALSPRLRVIEEAPIPRSMCLSPRPAEQEARKRFSNMLATIINEEVKEAKRSTSPLPASTSNESLSSVVPRYHSAPDATDVRGQRIFPSSVTESSLHDSRASMSDPDRISGLRSPPRSMSPVESEGSDDETIHTRKFPILRGGGGDGDSDEDAGGDDKEVLNDDGPVSGRASALMTHASSLKSEVERTMAEFESSEDLTAPSKRPTSPLSPRRAGAAPRAPQTRGMSRELSASPDPLASRVQRTPSVTSTRSKASTAETNALFEQYMAAAATKTGSGSGSLKSPLPPAEDRDELLARVDALLATVKTPRKVSESAPAPAPPKPKVGAKAAGAASLLSKVGGAHKAHSPPSTPVHHNGGSSTPASKAKPTSKHHVSAAKHEPSATAVAVTHSSSSSSSSQPRTSTKVTSAPAQPAAAAAPPSVSPPTTTSVSRPSAAAAKASSVPLALSTQSSSGAASSSPSGPSPIAQALRQLAVAAGLPAVVERAGPRCCDSKRPSCKYQPGRTHMLTYWTCDVCEEFDLCDDCYQTMKAHGHDGDGVVRSGHNPFHPFHFHNNQEYILKLCVLTVALLALLVLLVRS